jgi:hypothetical protein
VEDIRGKGNEKCGIKINYMEKGEEKEKKGT